MWWVMMCCRGCPSYLRSLDLKVRGPRGPLPHDFSKPVWWKEFYHRVLRQQHFPSSDNCQIHLRCFCNIYIPEPTQDLLNKNICARAQLGTLKKLPRIVLLAAINQIVIPPHRKSLFSEDWRAIFSLFWGTNNQANYCRVLFFNFFEEFEWSYRTIE